MLIYGSVCSGIEAASVAWHPLGWRAAFVSEIEPFPRALLAHHYPTVPLHGDFTTIQNGDYESIDLLVGGTPCQSFSVAGLRGGMADERGNLALEYLRLADRLRPQWLVWENVPGVLSSGGGRDFGSFLGGLVELGYGFAYRVLDAQYFGVPQRRRRVFVVGHLGDWRHAAAVLFERHCLSGNSAPRRQARQDVASYAPSSIGGYSEGVGTLRAHGGDYGGGTETLIASTGNVKYLGNAEGGALTAPYLTCANIEGVAHALRGEGFDASEDGTGRGTPLVPVAIAFDCKASGQSGFGVGEIASTLRAMGHKESHTNGGGHQAVAFHENQRAELTVSDTAGALKNGGGKPGQRYPALLQAMRVRRLTPRECERLQGFPDDYTFNPHWTGWRKMDADETPEGCIAHGFEIRQNKKTGRWRVKDVDGPRYKALGNSMAVPVMRWIGERIEMVEAL